MSSSVQNIDNILSLLDNLASSAIVARVGALFVTYVFLKTASFGLFNLFPILFEYVFAHVPTIKVPLEPMEEKDHADGERTKKVGLKDLKRRGLIQCFDPSTGMRLGEVKAMTVEEVGERVEVAKEAQREWSKTTFKQRRLVLRTIQKYIVNNIEPITRVCSRDSGKPKVRDGFAEGWNEATASTISNGPSSCFTPRPTPGGRSAGGGHDNMREDKVH